MSLESRDSGKHQLAHLRMLGRSQLIAFPISREVSNNPTKPNMGLILTNDDLPSLDPSKMICLPIRVHPALKLSKRLSVIMKVYPQIVADVESELK